MTRFFRSLWRFSRQLADDDAYERYREHHFERHANEPLLDRRAFYLEQQRRKWDGLQRCC
jgi:uncharacterized short protein YbdD (DUF466 family)